MMIATKTYWICVRAKVGSEFKKRDRLNALNYTTYLPVKKTDIRTKRKQRTELSALFPPYFFVKIIEGLTDLRPIKREAQIVHISGMPAEASDTLIDIIRAKEQDGIHATKHAYEEGDQVRMETGYFAGYEGAIRKLNKRDKAIISILATGKEVEINLKDAQPLE